MSLLVYNLTAVPLVLANGLSTTIPASTAGVGVRGLPWYASGNELNGRSAPEYAALQAQANPSSGVGDSFAVAGANVTLTDAAGAFITNNVGQSITIANATSPANNGVFLVTARTATTITFTNALGVAEAFAGTYSLPGLVAFVWTDYQEYPTVGLSVLASENFFAVEDFIIYAGPAGVAGAAGTASAPTTIEDALARLPGYYDKRCQLRLLPGTYNPPATTQWRCGKQRSTLTSSPFILLGDFTNVLGDRTSDAASATGASITDSGLTGALTVATTLSAAINAVVTTIPVVSVAGLPANGFVQIDSEIIAYAAISGLNLTGCQRGAGAGAASHLIAASVAMESPYRGHFISIVVAGVVTQRREIISNTAGGQFNVNAKFSPIPVAGAVFRVEAPAVQINIPAGGMLAFPGDSSWGQKGIFWNGGANSFNVPDGSLCLSSEGIWYRGTSSTVRPTCLVARSALFRGGPIAAIWAVDGANNPFSASRAQAGVTYRYWTLFMREARIENAFLVVDSCNIGPTESSTMELFSPFGRFTSFICSRNACISGITSDTSANPITSVLDVGDGNNQPLQLGNMTQTRNVNGALQINNSNTSAIRVNGNSVAQNIGSNSATLNITGTGNVRYGLEIDTGCEFQLQNQGITLTGLLGDIKLGQKPVMTWAQLRARYPFASAPNNVASDYVPAAPVKRAFTGLGGLDSYDITTLGVAPFASPALVVGALRVVTGAATFVGSYAVTDVGGTPLSPAASTLVGLATLTDDGKTITFPVGAAVTAFTIEYVPVDPVNVSGALAINNSV